MTADAIEVRRKRAIYRANHRGTKEMDVLAGRYAEAKVADFNSDELERFERLLAVADPLWQSWIFSPGGMAESEFSAIVRDMRVFHGLPELDESDQTK
jgi:antitoxin CptB